MSKHTIDAAEVALKKALTQKDGLKDLVDKIHKAEPMLSAAYGYSSEATLHVKQALGDARRAYQLVEGLTRYLAGSIHLMDTADQEEADAKSKAQPDLFDQEHKPKRNPVPLPAAATGTPTLARPRTMPGGDAHDSFSAHTLAAEEPHLQGIFYYDNRRYVAVGLSAGHWIDAYEVFGAEEERGDYEQRGLYTGQCVHVRDEPVILGSLVRFVAAVEEAEVATEVEYEIVENGEAEEVEA